MQHLIKVTETYRIDTEQEVEAFLKKLKADPRFEVSKYSSTKKELKAKGDVIDEWIHLEVTKVFDDEKSPIGNIKVSYGEDDEYED